MLEWNILFTDITLQLASCFLSTVNSESAIAPPPHLRTEKRKYIFFLINSHNKTNPYSKHIF